MESRVQQPADITEKLLVAPLEIISYEALREGSKSEATKLFSACCQDGAFYLDIAGTEPGILNVIDDIYTLEKGLFGLPEKELMRYDIDVQSPKKLNGYKPMGRNRGDLAGGKDGFQSYGLSKDGIMNIGSSSDFKHPPLVDTYMSSLQTFSRAISTAVTVILTSLSSTLKLLPSEALQDSHRPYVASPDLIRLLRCAAQPLSERGSSHYPHTDLGSLTFLFTHQYGLQILSAGEWKWVEPKAGHAIVNLGDCLSLLTNNLLKSCTHRVGALPGRPMEERYSFAYLLRPEDETIMKAVRSPLVGMTEGARREEEEITCAEWMRRKYEALRMKTWDEKKRWIITGTA